MPQSPPPSSPSKEVEALLSMPHEEGEIHEEVYPKEEERVFGKENDLQFKRKEKDLQEANMINTSQRMEMEEKEGLSTTRKRPSSRAYKGGF